MVLRIRELLPQSLGILRKFSLLQLLTAEVLIKENIKIYTNYLELILGVGLFSLAFSCIFYS